MIQKNFRFVHLQIFFANDRNFDNHWVGHSVMKPVDAESFQRRKGIKGGHKDINDNFYMEIMGKGALEKALNV